MAPAARLRRPAATTPEPRHFQQGPVAPQPSTGQRFGDISARSAPEVQAPASAAPTKEHTQTTRYYARRESRDVVLEVTPTGISIIDGESQFFHLTTILSWRVRRSEAGQPVGFKLVFTDGTEMIFSTDQGREISDTMMAHAQGLAALMHNGMHVRGTAMVN